MTVKDEYKRVRRSLLAKANRMAKHGYLIPENYIPAIPKKITKSSISRLKKLSEKIVEKSQYVIFDTGEVISGKKGKQYERQKLAEKAKRTRKEKREAERRFWEGDMESIPETPTGQTKRENYADFTNTILSEYRRQIMQFPEKVASIVLNALNRAIQSAGKEAVAQRIENNAESLTSYLNNTRLFGDSISAIIAYCSAMFGQLEGMTKSDIQSVNDVMDGASYEGEEV